MSYIQGTQVKITFTVINDDTNKSYDPPSAQVAVLKPSGAITTLTIADGQIVRMVDPVTSLPIVGKYRTYIDTTAEHGDYAYEVSVGGTAAVLKRRSFHVEASISPPPPVLPTAFDGGAPDTVFTYVLDGGAPDTVYDLIIDGGAP